MAATVSVEGFKARYPELAAIPNAFVQTCLSDAVAELKESRWGVLYLQGVYALAAHKFALSPYGMAAKRQAQEMKQPLTDYDAHWKRLLNQVTIGVVVV